LVVSLGEKLRLLKGSGCGLPGVEFLSGKDYKNNEAGPRQPARQSLFYQSAERKRPDNNFLWPFANSEGIGNIDRFDRWTCGRPKIRAATEATPEKNYSVRQENYGWPVITYVLSTPNGQKSARHSAGMAGMENSRSIMGTRSRLAKRQYVFTKEQRATIPEWRIHCFVAALLAEHG